MCWMVFFWAGMQSFPMVKNSLKELISIKGEVD